jgi:hypothetical protein
MPGRMNPYWYQYALVLGLLVAGYARWRRLGHERGFVGAYLACLVSMSLFTDVLGDFAHVRQHDDIWMTILRLGITIACCLYTELWIGMSIGEPPALPAARVVRARR